MSEDKLVPLYNTTDPDVLRASEAWGAAGQRQLRVVKIEDIHYMDERDVAWLIDMYTQTLFWWKWYNFWSQVALAVAIQELTPPSFAAIFYGSRNEA